MTDTRSKEKLKALLHGAYLVQDQLNAEIASLRAERDRMREALTEVETVMMIVEPRSHKLEYLSALANARRALSAGKNSVAEPAHPRGTGPASDSGSDQGKQG